MDKVNQSISNLINIIQELQVEITALKGGFIMRACDVCRDKADLLDYIEEYDIDYIVFITPGQFVMNIDREKIDQLTESSNLVDFINGNWHEETIAIVLP